MLGVFFSSATKATITTNGHGLGCRWSLKIPLFFLVPSAATTTDTIVGHDTARPSEALCVCVCSERETLFFASFFYIFQPSYVVPLSSSLSCRLPHHPSLFVHVQVIALTLVPFGTGYPRSAVGSSTFSFANLCY